MLALLLLGPALAQDALSLEAVRHAQVGLGAPSLTFLPGVTGALDARLSCGNRSYSWSGAIRPGQPQTLSLTDLPQGSHTCQGSVTLEVDDGTQGELPLSLDVWMHPPLKLTVDRQALDLDSHTLTLQGSRPIGRVEIEVLGEKGHRIGSGAVAGMAPELSVDVEWQQAPGEALKLEVTAWDEHDLPGRIELSPWSYAIPHEDVVFESGQAEVLLTEAPKLEKAWSELQDVRNRYGDVVEVRLYVAGYTDTVGDSASNRALSKRRARAIAIWFRERGFDGPIEKRRAVAEKTRARAARVARYLRAVGISYDPTESIEALVAPGMEEIDFNSDEFRRASVPAANGHFTARSLARMYACLAGGGTLDGVRLLSPETLTTVKRVQNTGIGRVIPISMRWRMGYHRVFAVGGRAPGAFGHFGFGGSGAWADPDRNLSVALTVNSGVGTPFGDSRIARIGGAAIRCADRR